jgi:hypothetical protein
MKAATSHLELNKFVQTIDRTDAAVDSNPHLTASYIGPVFVPQN